jgi:hypothetical protein
MYQYFVLFRECFKTGAYVFKIHYVPRRRYLVAQSVWCLTMDWTTRVRSPAEEKYTFPLACVQTGSEAQKASYEMGTGFPFPGGKARPSRDADYPPPSSAEVKK